MSHVEKNILFIIVIISLCLCLCLCREPAGAEPSHCCKKTPQNKLSRPSPVPPHPSNTNTQLSQVNSIQLTANSQRRDATLTLQSTVDAVDADWQTRLTDVTTHDRRPATDCVTTT